MQTEIHTPIIDLNLGLKPSLSNLGSSFFSSVKPQPLPNPYWVGKSESVAKELGLTFDLLNTPEALSVFSGNAEMYNGQYLASVYSGHQFGVWAGQLGDGRALLLGKTSTNLEIQLKGSGPTPYSRMGDGRAVLRSSIREFLCSEAMFGLGIPTTRALCITGSDAPIRRETYETAAVVTRVAESFIRFGHFEHFSSQRLVHELKILADHVIDQFYPHCREHSKWPNAPYAALLEAISEKTAKMVSKWQAVGFCHGVLNTDNMSAIGLTLDYGPFQFLDNFDPAHICNHTDQNGRYAYDKQPNIVYWNLFCLGQALMPLIDSSDQALEALESFKAVFPKALAHEYGNKLGISKIEPDSSNQDKALIEDLIVILAKYKVDYTIFWRRLSHSNAGQYTEAVESMFDQKNEIKAWLMRYSLRHKESDKKKVESLMLQSNPKFVLRNHLGEQAIQLAKNKDFSGVSSLLAILLKPYDEHPNFESYADFPPSWASGIEISCSS